MHNSGGTAVTDTVSRGIPGRLAEMYEVASQLTDKPLKVSVGAGPPNLTYHVDFNVPGSKYSSARKLAEDLVPIFNADLKELAARGASFIQIEDLGAWMLALDDDSNWVLDVLNAWIEGVDAKIAWHCCLGAGYGNTFRAVEDALPRVLERWMAVNVEQYALDFALRDMVDVKALEVVSKDKEPGRRRRHPQPLHRVRRRHDASVSAPTAGRAGRRTRGCAGSCPLPARRSRCPAG
ncbi:MAG: 5-methyltetrahydropteroyltriglutamate--homocysteine methyltransferase [Solirubrobacteraceae bacterium]